MKRSGGVEWVEHVCGESERSVLPKHHLVCCSKAAVQISNATFDANLHIYTHYFIYSKSSHARGPGICSQLILLNV